MDTDEDSGAREMGEGEGEGEGEEEVGSQDGLEEEEVGDEVSSEREGEREMKEPRDLVKVRVLEYEKLEEDFIYTLEVVVNNGRPVLLHHKYSDVKWLYRLLARKVDLNGHILPPMPEPPAPLQPHQELLGVPQSSMFGEYSRLACLDVETFLQALGDHPFFSDHHEVHSFLTSERLPSHDTIGSPSLWASITSAYSNYQLSNVQDTDGEFVVLLRNMNGSLAALETCTSDFTQLVTAWQRLACAEVRVRDCVKEWSEWEVGRSDSCALSLVSLSNILDDHQVTGYQKYNLSASTDAQNTIGFTFDLLYRHSKQAKDMLYRRLEKVQLLINASRQLDKAKPEKKPAAEQARTAAMKDYERTNKTAQTEMDRFTRHCVRSLGNSLTNFTEAQVTHSRCVMAQLSSLLTQIKITVK